MQKLRLSFYQQGDVIALSRALLGCALMTRISDQQCGGLICETEAYAGINDRASHAYNGRFTRRTRIMYEPGGISYVYLCYGIHHLFNVVTSVSGTPDAILIRGIVPVSGITYMENRLNIPIALGQSIDGPGRLTKALGIRSIHNGISLLGDEIWIENAKEVPSDNEIVVTTRVGINYAGEDAKLLNRFLISAPGRQRLFSHFQP
jgi:DNA-3-methyladenine glycosylase